MVILLSLSNFPVNKYSPKSATKPFIEKLAILLAIPAYSAGSKSPLIKPMTERLSATVADIAIEKNLLLRYPPTMINIIDATRDSITTLPKMIFAKSGKVIASPVAEKRNMAEPMLENHSVPDIK